MTVVALGADHAGFPLKQNLKQTPFEGGRHERRLARVARLEVAGAQAR